MKISAVIAEYNPFHNGHQHQLTKTRENGADAIIAVMSGSFVQRGEPAIMSKWARAKAALIGGADLVLELPLPYAVSSAGTFARGGVSIIDRLSVVNELSFGAECDEVKSLSKISQALESEETDVFLKQFLDMGMSYPSALGKAIFEVLGEEYSAIIKQPNNILAIEYMKALHKTKGGISPFAVRRRGAGHDSGDASGSFASASYIRELILNGDAEKSGTFMPSISNSILVGEMDRGLAMTSYEKFEIAMMSKLRFMDKKTLAKIADVSEGLENRIVSSVLISRDLNQLYGYVKTKRYTMSKIRRILLSAFLDITSEFSKDEPPYVRVLGFNEQGREILRQARDRSDIPIIMKASDINDLKSKGAKKMFELECRATDQYSLLIPSVQPCGTDKTANAIRL